MCNACFLYGSGKTTVIRAIMGCLPGNGHVSGGNIIFDGRNQTPEMLLEEKQLREKLYAAVMALPEKQAKRIYARYYLGMRVGEIAAAEGVDPSRVRDSIRRGLKQLAKYF